MQLKRAQRKINLCKCLPYERFKINSLNTLGKEEQTKPKTSRMKEMTEIRAKSN